MGSLIGIGAGVPFGGGSGIPSDNLAAAFDANTGITSSGGFASAWADRSGNGRNLLQATGANQPIHLDYAGTKYGWLPGVVGNYFSTPDSVAASITGDIDIDAELALADWSPAVEQRIVGKVTTDASGFSYLFRAQIGNTLQFYYSVNGTTLKSATSSATITFSDGAFGSVRVTLNTSTGDVKFYTSTDGSSWNQLGTTQSTVASSIFDSLSPVTVGATNSGTDGYLSGKVKRVRIYNGIRESGGTLAVDFDPSRWTSGTTFTASTGETWTINSTGSKPAQIVDRPSLLFDGSAHYMKCSAFTLNQPETVYLVAKQVTWGNRYLHDGNAGDSMVLFQNTASPQLALYAGSFSSNNSNATLGSKVVIAELFNGASSALRVNLTTEVTGNVGAANAGGFTLAENAGGASRANIQAYEALIYNVAHDAATRANIIRALMAKWGST